MVICFGRVLASLICEDDYLQLWRIAFNSSDNSRGVDYFRGTFSEVEGYARRNRWINATYEKVEG